MEFTEDRIQIEDSILTLKYSYDLLSSIDPSAYVPDLSDTLLYIDGETEYALCILEYDDGRQAHWSALFAAGVGTTPQVKIIDDLVIVKFGFRIHALNKETGKRVWLYESKYPVLSIYEHLSRIVFVSDVEVGLLVGSGECVWQYEHRELIIEASEQQDGIRFKDFDNQQWFISWSGGTAHLIE